ncbi:MAG: sulfatase-like hydrolase/transferase, partial [Oceanococcaceae bacterium]
MGRLFRGVVLGIAWPVIAAVTSPAALANAAPPNLVLVVVDDLGFSDLGSFGSEIRTPHIDALAAEGRRFANFHATGMCAPSRAILMSGEDHHAVGVGNMPESMPLRHRGQPGYAGTLDPNVLTVAQRLRAVGYRNYFVGKWHLGKTPALLPFARGFDRTITLADTGADNYEQRPYMPMDAQAHWFADGQPLTLPADFYSSEYLVDRAIEFIETDAARDQPFFLTLGFLAVHIPLQVPREFSDRYAGKYADGWEHLRRTRHQGAIANGVIPADAPLAMMPSMAAWDDLDADEQRYQARRMEIYAGMLEAMDHHLGRLVTHLQRRGDWDNTVVVVLSDNGAEPNDPRAMPTMRLWARTVGYSMDLDDLGDRGSHVAIGPHWASAAAAPGQQYKMLAGEGGIRVPLIIRAPESPQPGAVYQPFAHVLDIVPTLLDLARGEVPAAMPGRSLRPAIADPAAAIR